MVPEIKPRGAPDTKKQRHPQIPTRSSSISRANGKVPQKRPKMTARHSYAEDSGPDLRLSHHNPTSMSTTVAHSHAKNNVDLPLTMDEESSSRMVPSRNLAVLAKVQRWAGLTRSVCDWDGLRKVSGIRC
jgi:hypothetical protein